MSTPKISAVLIAKNEEAMLANCIRCLQWCSEVIVIDNGSTDATPVIAEQLGAKVISFKHSSFSRLRNEGMKHVTGEWIIYIDADERVSPTLAKEIQVLTETKQAEVFFLKRQNILYGEPVSYGGYQADMLERVFYKKALQKWTGEIHESPEYTGKAATIQTPLLHLTHRNTQDNLLKSASWTKMEAVALHKALEKPVGIATILRKMVVAFIKKAVFKQGYKDGQTGLIEALVQGINRALVYIQVWELQKNPSIIDRYRQYEDEMQSLWKKER